MITKTKPQTKRSAEAQKRKHINEFKQLDAEYQAIKKDIDVIEAETARRLEAYRNLHSKEMRRLTDEYQMAVLQYKKYVLDPIGVINSYKARERYALKKKLEPYHKKLALHPGRPMTEDEVFIKDALEERRLQWIKEEKEKPQWVRDLEKCEREQRWEIRTMRENKQREYRKAYYQKKKLEKLAQSTTA